MKIYLPHSTSFDYIEEFYKPLKTIESELDLALIFPHEKNAKPQNSYDLIKSCDLVIAEVSYPSTGLGIELGWANQLNVPIVCVYQRGKRYSQSLGIITDQFFEYENYSQLIEIIRSIIRNFGCSA